MVLSKQLGPPLLILVQSIPPDCSGSSHGSVGSTKKQVGSARCGQSQNTQKEEKRPTSTFREIQRFLRSRWLFWGSTLHLPQEKAEGSSRIDRAARVKAARASVLSVAGCRERQKEVQTRPVGH